MPVTILSTPYHQQETEFYCGAASAQMVLDSVGAGLHDQISLYADGHRHSVIDGNWYVGPDGLEWIMNDRNPQGLKSRLVLSALFSEEAISRKIVWTIHRYGVAPIALVYGEHWVVVRGVEVTAEPSSSTDTSYTINGFYLNNPAPETPDHDGPPPHRNGTDGCGTGGVRGYAHEHVTYATWQDTYMGSVLDGYWSGKFLAVCDPEPGIHEPSRPVFRKSLYRGDQILPPRLIADLALRGLQEHQLGEETGWREALADVEPGEPLLVQRLDRNDSYYYLVPLRSHMGGVLAAVDALSGDYRQAAILPREEDLLLRMDQQGLLLDRLEAFRSRLQGLRNGGLVLRREALSLSPALVWKPCRESLSPLYPFYVFTFGSRQLYLRVDGRVFTRLTSAGRGV